jgi:gamma-glutamyl-gamma-aminobutyrate hydrolase PuuD
LALKILIPAQIAALCGGSKPDFAPTLYTHLISQPEYASSESRQALMRRLREALVKLVPLIGVCKCLEAIFDIEAITKKEDKEYSFSR